PPGTDPGGFAASEPTRPVSASADLTVIPDQHIFFAAISDLPLTVGHQDVHPTSDSDLAVTVTSLTPAVCDVAPNGSGGYTVTGYLIGTCTLRAAQAGNGVYPAAIPVDRKFDVVSNHADMLGSDYSAGRLD